MKKRLLMVILLLALMLLMCGCASKAAKVDERIEAIGTVTLDSEEQIVAAETAYQELTDKDKAKVTGYQVLVDARDNYDDQVKQAAKAAERARQEAQEKQKATELAGKILTKMAVIYKNPLSIKVNHVWYSHSDHDSIDTWYFTFDLNLTNATASV